MDWFYSGMLRMHELLAWASLVLFFARGLAAQFKAEWGADDRLRAVSFGLHFLLAVSGLSLWGLLHYDLLRDSWLATKLLALCAYAACAHWTVVSRDYRLPAYLGALTLLGYAIGASLTRSATLGL